MNKTNASSRRTFGARQQSGYTLIELSITISLIALAFVLAWVFWAPIKAMFTGTNDNQNQLSLNTSLQRIGMSGSYGSGNLLPRIVDTIPTNWKNTGTKAAPIVTNGYRGAVTVTGNDTTYTVTSDKIPSGACADLVTALRAQDVNTAISVGGQTWSSGAAVDPSDAAAACNATASNKVTWVGQP